MNTLHKSIALLFLLIVIGLQSCQSPTKDNGDLRKSNNTSLIDSSRDAHSSPSHVDSIKKIVSHPIHHDSTKNYVYLTFDDGPQHGTSACFALCKELGVKATFFMVGMHATTASPNLKRMVDTIRDAYPQSLLCNHSSTHANGKYRYFYQHPLMALQDFYTAQQTLQVPLKIIRLPGNSAWVLQNEMKTGKLVRATCHLLDSSGYNIIGWDTEWNFNHKTANPIQSATKMAQEVLSALRNKKTHRSNHVVLLAHDRMFRSQNFVDSLARFITLVQQDSTCVFETIDHYPSLKPLE